MSWCVSFLHDLFHGLCVQNAIVEKDGPCVCYRCRKCGVITAISYFDPDDEELHFHVCEGYKKFSNQIISVLKLKENHPLRRSSSSYRKED